MTSRNENGLNRKYTSWIIIVWCVGLLALISFLINKITVIEIIFVSVITTFIMSSSYFILKNKYRNVTGNNHQRKQTVEYIPFIDQAPIPILFIENNTIKDVNALGLELMGATRKEELVSQSIFSFLPQERDRFQPILGDSDNQKISRFDGTVIRLDGQVINVEINLSSILYKGELRHCLSVRTKGRNGEDERRLQHYEQLSVLGELAAGIAHEVRNPLTSLKGFIQIVESECVNTKRYTEIMSSEVDRINEIVNEMLMLSKPKVVKFEEKKLLPIIDLVVTLVNTQAILYNIEIVVDFEEDLQDVEVGCEENKLKQVFINLTKNAIEAMPEGGMIKVQVKSNNGRIVVHIIDQGIGIPQEQLHNIGKSFYSTKEKGTGLGLMICRRIIEDHDGEMLIHSEEGKGTDVEVQLPIANGVMTTTC
ncbi:hypothetical protein BTR23_02950 [Alkalihalophilus pseudofirmus]|nr:hypothetical protein BTR23_02950 [Alkalihalophilus pseudofirmus]